MADERYMLKSEFGSRSASNNTSACRDCGAPDNPQHSGPYEAENMT